MKLAPRDRALEEMLARLDADAHRGDHRIASRSWSAARPAAGARKGPRGAGSRDAQAGRGICRAPIRAISVARLELERLRREGERSPEQRDRNRQAVAEKERLRAEREQELAAQREELEKLEGGGRAHRRRARGDARGTRGTRRAPPRRTSFGCARGKSIEGSRQPPHANRPRNLAPGDRALASAGQQYRARPYLWLIERKDCGDRGPGQSDGSRRNRNAGLVWPMPKRS